MTSTPREEQSQPKDQSQPPRTPLIRPTTTSSLSSLSSSSEEPTYHFKGFGNGNGYGNTITYAKVPENDGDVITTVEVRARIFRDEVGGQKVVFENRDGREGDGESKGEGRQIGEGG